MPDWYPGCKVRLVVRLEDNSKGIYPPPLTPTETGAGPESFGPGSPDGVPPPDDTITIDVVPDSATVEINNYRTADTAKVEFALARLPIHPALIRAVSVQVFGGVFHPTDFATANGARGSQGIVIPDLADPRVSVPDSFGGHTNELFRGFADKASITINASEGTIAFDCRDLMGELLDAEIPPNMLADLPGYLRLDEAIQLLLTGDALADEQQDQRFTEEQTKAIGRKRRELEAKVRVQLDKLADAEADDDAGAAAAATAQIQTLRGQINQLRAAVEGLPITSVRFGMPGFRGIRVKNEVIAETDATGTLIADLPTIEDIRPKAWLDSRGTTRKGRKKSTANKAKVSFGDFISDLITSAGYIWFLRAPKADLQLVATELVISNPRTYYGSSTTAGISAPGTESVRTLVWGLNLEELQLERSLKGTAVPSVGVRAYDATTGERYGVIYPAVPKNNRAAPTKQGDRTEIKQFNLDQISGNSPEDIRNKLRLAAMSIYEQLSRGDLKLQAKTSLAGIPEFAKRGIVGDMFALRPRDPVELELPAEDPTTGLVSPGLILDETDIGKRIEQGRLAGLDADSAQKLAIASASQYVQREFRTTTLTCVFSNGAWEINVGAINYLDIRDSIAATNAAS